MNDKVRTIVVLGGAIGAFGAILWLARGEFQQSSPTTSGPTVSGDNLYADFTADPPYCAQLITAYNGAMTNGDGINTREQDANYVQNILWYAKERILRKYPQSGWAQPEHLEEAAKWVFKSCQAENGATDQEPSTIDKIVDGLMQLSPYSEDELVH
jgi:hypothetical protein